MRWQSICLVTETVDNMGEKQNPPFPLSISTSMRGRQSRGRIARSATGRSEAAQVVEVYNALAEVYADHYESGNPDRPFLEEFLSHLQTGTRLLDVGCGTGSGAKYFFDRGMRVEGIDLSGSMIEVARQNFPHIRFTRKDIRNSKYRAGHFDAIWAGYSLFHMGREDFQAVLKRIRKALAPDGIFGLIMQEGKGDVQFPEPLCPGKSLLVCLYSIRELTALLSTEGFNVIARKRRGPVSELEYPYQKLLLVSQAVSQPGRSVGAHRAAAKTVVKT
jgi:SAM-dependent methyltransferase